MKTITGLCAALLVATLAGCQSTKPLYHYGSYQSNVYEFFKNEDGSASNEIAELEKTLQDSAARQQPAGPGLYAHLGYLYIQSGQTDTGIDFLLKEKELYPESAQYIDFLLKNAKASKS
jgi:hypothetical protein